MNNYRQTNHNGRVSAKTGTVYNRKHNDRDFEGSHGMGTLKFLILKQKESPK